MLGLPPLPFVGPLNRQEQTGMPLYYAYSPTVLPRPTDWSTRIHVTGYLFSDPPAGWQPLTKLLSFLEHGPTPVYIGFGGIPMHDPEATLRLVLAALEQSGQRAVL